MHQIWWIITALLLNTSKNLCAFKKSGSFARNCTQTFLNKQRQQLSLLGPTQTLLHQWTDEAKQMQIMLKVKKLKKKKTPKNPQWLWFYMQLSVCLLAHVLFDQSLKPVLYFIIEREWESKHGDRRAEVKAEEFTEYKLLGNSCRLCGLCLPLTLLISVSWPTHKLLPSTNSIYK